MAETSEPIAVLILGSVRRTGEGVLKRLVEKGCTVVVGNRAPDPEAARRDGYYAERINLLDSTELGNQADTIRRQRLGPSKYFNVVIYNGMRIFLAVYMLS
jgi:NAD(P)-dependent dehydrogenase (short-subunit alcohol dehydrogenase family)